MSSLTEVGSLSGSLAGPQRLGGGLAPLVISQADWAEADSSKSSFIRNKPENLVQDAGYVHTDSNYTADEKTKLSGIEAGAEVNVQADWNQTVSTADDYIKNKPINLVQDASYVHTDNNYTTAEKTKLSGVETGAQVNVQADWDQATSTADDYIKNKPANLVQDANYIHTDSNYTAEEKTKLSGIEAGAQVNTVASVAGKTGTVTLDADDIAYDKTETYSNGTVGKTLVSVENAATNLDYNKADAIIKSASGSVVSFDDGANGLPISLTTSFAFTQSGTGDPAPDNIRPISGLTGVTINRSDADTSDPTTYNISWQAEKGTLYSGTLTVADSGVCTLEITFYGHVFDGTETITELGSGTSKAVRFRPGVDVVKDGRSCSHFPNATIITSSTTQGYYAYKLTSSGGSEYGVMQFRYASLFTTSEGFQTYCATQYANGTPVTAVAQLETPITYTLSSVTQLKTLLGTNNWWCETGDLAIQYRVDTKIAVDEKADTDLGISGASVGQYAKIKTVDADGKPTEWESGTPSGGGGTSDYTDLTNKPSINSVTLSGNKTASDLGLGTYSKPVGGIPATDLANTYAGAYSANGPAIKTNAVPIGVIDNTSTSTAITIQVSEFTNETVLRDGLFFYVYNGVIGSAATYTVDVNGLGAKPVYTPSGGRSETGFSTGRWYLFCYSTTFVTDGCWILGYITDTDTNTNTVGYILRTNETTLSASDKFYRYRMLFTSADGTKFVPANTSTSTSSTSAKTPNSRAIDPFGRIVYYGTTSSIAAGSKPSKTVLWDQTTVTLGYSFNSTGAALTMTAWEPVYLKCTPKTDGSAEMIECVQALPSTADGKIYIFLGIAISETQIELYALHPIYYYANGAIRLWTNADVPTIPTITDTYDGTSSDGMSGKAVKSAIDALDGTVSGSAGSGKTLTAFSQTDGKVSATFGNISITKSQVSDFPTLATVATSGNYTDLTGTPTIPSTASEVGAIAAPSSPATGAFLVWDGSAWTAQTLSTWQGGNY